MRGKEKQLIKEARIVRYWEELSRLRLDLDAAVELISYIFSINERWVLQIIKKSPEEFEGVELKHFDLEIQIIESYYDKIKAEAQAKRAETVQGKLDLL